MLRQWGKSRRTFDYRGESVSLDDAARSSLPGSFVALPDGVVHYELAGPADGQVVVLIPGFSVPFYVWDPTCAALAQAGLRVLRYDLYGRGYSDRPDATYDHNLFERQLANLSSALNLREPVDVIGLSMGGIIAVVFTDRHPDRVRRLGLFAPAGLQVKTPWTAKLIVVPGLGEILMSWFGDKILVSGQTRDFYQPDRFPDYAARYIPALKYRGFKRAILSTLRYMPLQNAREFYERVGQQERPVLLIWGRHDKTIPLEMSERVKQAIPHVEFHVIEQAGHLAHYERPEVVNPLLVEFLKNRKGAKP